MTARFLGVFLACFGWAGACATPGGDDSDSNTNWLSGCDSDADCHGLSCECGLCTKPCDAVADCQGLGTRAACLPGAEIDVSCPAPGSASGLCTRECTASGDCGPEATCVRGRCAPKSAHEAGTGRQREAGIDRQGDAGDGSVIDSPPDASGGCFFNFPPGGCRGYPENAYGASFYPSGCVFSSWAVGCLDYYICSVPCSKTMDCPDGGSGNATPHCDFYSDAGDGAGWCILECDAGTVCPLGMACVTSPGGRRGCYWATDTDCPACPVFPSCMNN